MSWFCHLVIISSKYILNILGERGQPRCTPLFISTSFDSLLLNFINIFLCVCKCPLLPSAVCLGYALCTYDAGNSAGSSTYSPIHIQRYNQTGILAIASKTRKDHHDTKAGEKIQLMSLHIGQSVFCP